MTSQRSKPIENTIMQFGMDLVECTTCKCTGPLEIAYTSENYAITLRSCRLCEPDCGSTAVVHKGHDGVWRVI